MAPGKWELEISEIIGKVKNELENNRIDHEQMRDCLHDIKDALQELPCTDHAKDLVTLKTKLSKPWLIGALVIALAPMSFLFWSIQDAKKEFSSKAAIVQKTQKILRQFVKENGYLLLDDGSKNIEKGGREGDK